MKSQALLLSYILLLPLAHADQVYKCKAASGETIYQNEPCPKGSVTVAQGSYDRQPDDPTTQQAATAEAAETNARREYEVQAAATARDNQREQPSAYAQETAARRAQVEAGSYASRVGQRGRAKTQAEVEAAQAKGSEPQRIKDQYGNSYIQRAGSRFVKDAKTGKLCFKVGEFLDCQ